MSAVDTINKVIHAGVLTPEMTIIPSRGATDAEIQEEEARLGRRLRAEHVTVLRRWNGIGLDVVRLFGCGARAGRIGRLSELQVPTELRLPDALVIGSDASGFLYVQAGDGRVFEVDTDGGGVDLLASDLDDLLGRVIFGRDAREFAGEDWLEKLRQARIVS